MNESESSQNRSEKEIFFEAVEKSTPEARAAFLDGACGKDPALRARVESLLAEHFKNDSFMQSPAVEGDHPAIDLSPISEAAGAVIGRYKLLQKIGEGGMGVVYMAEQEVPVRRRVALKIIKLGMDTKQVVARFEAERQALAMMDHPNIARVLDGGATETGRPYFVMELVHGVPITEFCDKNKLPAHERLKLFAQVCHAIQSAHQKAIIHRDLKPSNVLVTLHHGEPMIKVIDFGIAKATNQKLTEKTLFTNYGTIIGTPAYMSPEQAEMSSMDVDTRSDVYSLGVLLYELLTGSTPFPEKRLMSLGYGEMQRVIMEEEPERPSTRLSTLDNEQKTVVARNRGEEIGPLSSLLKGDLDWVVMKCLEKDRSRRYETANALAMDLKRHMENEPVVARPPSNLYRFQKLARRNKTAFVAASAVFAALVMGLGFSTWSFLNERQARQRALAAEQTARTEARRADSNAAAERKQRARAEESAKEANEALSTSLVVEAEKLVRENLAGKALACLARSVRLNPNNHVAATRIVSMLNQRDFPLQLEAMPEVFAHYNKPQNVHWLGEGAKDQVMDNDVKKAIAQLQKKSKVYEYTISHDGKTLAASTADNEIEILRIATQEPVIPPISIPPRGTDPFAVFTPDDSQVAIVAAADGNVDVWRMTDRGHLLKTLPHRSTVWSISLPEDGRLLAAATRTGEIALWKLANGQPARESCPGAFSVWEAECSPKGDYLLTQEQEKEHFDVAHKRYWDIRPGRACPISLFHPDGAVVKAMYDGTDTHVATVCGDGTARVWQAEDGSLVCLPTNQIGEIATVAFSPDSSLLALGGREGEVGVWDLAKGRLSWSKLAHTDKITDLLFTRDGNQLISGSSDKDGSVLVFLARNGQITGQITNHLEGVMSLAINPNDDHLAIAYKDYRAEIWDLTKMRQVGEPLTSNQGTVWHAQFSHDGKWLATSSGGEGAQLWDAQRVVNTPLQFYPHGSGVYKTYFSSDDRLLFTCSYDKTARVWDRVSGRPITEPLLHRGRVWSGSFSPDNRAVVTASEDGTSVVWDAQTGQALSDPFFHAAGVNVATFSPDGRHILTAGLDGEARIHTWIDVREPAPAWLPELAEAVGGYRLNNKGVTEYCQDAATTLVRLRNELGNAPGATRLNHWANWYLADRANRNISDDSGISVRNYAAHLAMLDAPTMLDEALDLDPGNARAYAKLADFVEQAQPQTAALYRRIAEELGGPRLNAVKAVISPVKPPITNPVAALGQGFLDPRDGPAIMDLIKDGEKTLKFKGQVVHYGSSRSGTYRYLNFADRYQHSLTLAFRVADNPAEFQPETLQGYVNKTVTVEGKVAVYAGAPQILIKSLKEIQVIDDVQ